MLHFLFKVLLGGGLSGSGMWRDRSFFANNLLVFFTLFAWLKSVAPLLSVWRDRASPWDPFICCVILFFSLGNPSLKVVFWGLASVACTEPLLSVWRDRAIPWDANQRVQEGERGRK